MQQRARPQRLYSSWDSPGQSTGVGSLSLLQGIFPTQGLNPGLPHCKCSLYQLSHKGSPTESPVVGKWGPPLQMPNSGRIFSGIFNRWRKPACDSYSMRTSYLSSKSALDTMTLYVHFKSFPNRPVKQAKAFPLLLESPLYLPDGPCFQAQSPLLPLTHPTHVTNTHYTSLSPSFFSPPSLLPPTTHNILPVEL